MSQKQLEPNRREALSGLIATAAGAALVGVAPCRAPAAAVKPPDPSPPPPSAPYTCRADRDDCDADGEPLTSEQQQIISECQPLALAALWELEDAMQAVLDAQEDGGADDGDGTFYEDVAGISHFIDQAASLIDGYTDHDAEQKVKAGRKQRKRDFAAGRLACGDPILRGARALDAAEETLQAVLDRFPAESDTVLQHDCRHHLWFVRVTRGGYDNSAARRMTPAGRQAHIADLLGQDKELFAPGGPFERLTVEQIAAAAPAVV